MVVFIGTVHNGMVVLPPGAVLPDGTEVRVEPVGDTPGNRDMLDAAYSVLSRRFKSGETDVAAQHNEHQP